MKVEEVLARLQALAEELEIPAEEEEWVLGLTTSRSGSEVRTLAVVLAGDFLPPGEIVERLFPLLEDPDVEVRTATAYAMAEVVQEIESLDLLNASESALQLGDEEGISPDKAREVVRELISLISSATTEPTVRFGALCSLGPLGYMAEIEPRIREFMRSKDPEARVAALQSAAFSGMSEIWQHDVIAALGDNDEYVRAAAALTAGRLGLEAALPYLESMTLEATGDEQFSATLSSFLLVSEDNWSDLSAQLALRGVPGDVITEACEMAEILAEPEDEWDGESP